MQLPKKSQKLALSEANVSKKENSVSRLDARSPNRTYADLGFEFPQIE
jgi:hypothetical protein